MGIEIKLVDFIFLKYVRLLNNDLREEFVKSRGREKTRGGKGLWEAPRLSETRASAVRPRSNCASPKTACVLALGCVG